MVFSIQISFAQIGSSLEMSMDVPWPSMYTDWMANLSFSNFNVLGMLGVTCLPGMSYEVRFLSSTMIVFGIVLIVAVTYCFKARALQKKLIHINDEEKTHAANQVFDTVDVDEGGTLDPEEFRVCLDHISSSKKKLALTKVEIKDRMLALGARIPSGEYEPALERKEFVAAVLAGKLGGKDSTEWIRYLEHDILKSKYVSVAVQVMLLLHAPTTKRALWYNNAHHLVGYETRSFLKVDYSMEVLTPRWNMFLIFVLFTFLVYCLALPLYIFVSLFRSRKSLWKPKEMTKYGFLYARFQPGAEMWELHEIVRKNFLCGVIGFLPPTTRAAVAILVCVIAVACLNYFKPPRNRVIFLVAEAGKCGIGRHGLWCVVGGVWCFYYY